MRIDYDLIEKINDEIYDNDDFIMKNIIKYYVKS